ncbi:MAG: RDD family protein [Candidatus Obscuribacterales bacterium]|nr:RDD family protein [Candidatus Obscuribacterales bacterium]
MSRSFRGRPDPGDEPKQRGSQAYRGAAAGNDAQMRRANPYDADYPARDADSELSAEAEDNDEGAARRRDPLQVDMGKRLVSGLIDVVTGYMLGLFVNCIPFVNIFVHDQLVMVIYLLLRDSLFNGRGVGKNLMGLQVIDRHTGQAASLMQSFKRNIVIFGPYMALYLCNLVLKIVPNETASSIVNTVVVGIGSIYTLIVLPLEIYRVYSRVDGLRWGDDFAGTATVAADMDFSNPLSK